MRLRLLEGGLDVLRRRGRLRSAPGGAGIGAAAVLSVVETSLLDLCRNAQDADNLQETEHEEGAEPHPDDDGNHEGELSGELRTLRVAAVTEFDVGLGAIESTVVGVFIESTARAGDGSEQARREHTPDAAEEVDGRGVNDIVDADLLEQFGRAQVDRGGNEADAEGAVRLDDLTASSDSNKPAEDAVVAVRRVPGASAEPAEHHGAGTSSGSGDGSGHRDLARIDAVAGDGSGTDAVEAIPADPEDERADRLESMVLARPIVGVTSVKAAAARSEKNSSNKGSHSAGHVHDTAPREIDDTDSVAIGFNLGGPARLADTAGTRDDGFSVYSVLFGECPCPMETT